MNDRTWTISNGLSALRILLIIPISVVLINNDPALPALLYVLIGIAVVTDLLDGRVARMLNQETELGRILDPLADKLMIGTLSCVLAMRGAIPVWFLLSAVARDFIILAGGFIVRRSKHILVQSNLVGKWTVTFTAAFIISATTTVVPRWLYNALMVVSAGMMVISLVVYARGFFRIIRSQDQHSPPLL